mgnify:CR=1 FL=1
MLYVTDMPFGDSYLTISYNYDASLEVAPYGDTTVEDEAIDYWINEFMFDELVVEIDDPILLDFIDEFTLAGHEEVVRAEEEARYGD